MLIEKNKVSSGHVRPSSLNWCMALLSGGTTMPHSLSIKVKLRAGKLSAILIWRII
jgi:hypothetical protein